MRGRMTIRRRLRGRNGFVLIEALAAFTILTLALAALMLGVFGAVRNDDRAVFALQAARQARALLNELGVEAAPPQGVSSGKTKEGLPYVLTVAWLNTAPSSDPQGPRLRAFQAHLVLSRGSVGGRPVTPIAFDTVKIAPERSR